mmetsp:Transcript_46904/g.121682  ORF Transcript_46904/g.121682 Transcript_46904/m.121682 type:complete len:223 (-) Transcript_46904:336-1004(-)
MRLPRLAMLAQLQSPRSALPASLPSRCPHQRPPRRCLATAVDLDAAQETERVQAAVAVVRRGLEQKLRRPVPRASGAGSAGQSGPLDARSSAPGGRPARSCPRARSSSRTVHRTWPQAPPRGAPPPGRLDLARPCCDALGGCRGSHRDGRRAPPAPRAPGRPTASIRGGLPQRRPRRTARRGPPPQRARGSCAPPARTGAPRLRPRRRRGMRAPRCGCRGPR